MKISGIFVRCQLLVNDDDVACLKSLGALFDSELNLLAFLQVLETLALNGREVDEDILAAIACEKAVALRSIEPLDCTIDTFRHFCLLMARKKYGGYSLCCIGAASTAKTKRPMKIPMSRPGFASKANLLVSFGP